MADKLNQHEIWYYARHPKWGRAGGRAYTYRWETVQEAQDWIDHYGPGSDGEQYQIEMSMLFPPKSPCAETYDEPEPTEWPIAPKMRIKCIKDRFHPDGPSSHVGMIGTVLPGSMVDNKISWMVKFENDRVWDQCSEEYIRESFEPFE